MRAEREKEILGILLLSPGYLSLDESLTENLFSSPDRRRAFRGISQIYEDFKPTTIDIGLLSEKTGLSIQFVTDLGDGCYRPDPGNFILKIRGVRKSQLTADLMALMEKEARAHLKTDSWDPENIEKIRGLWQEIQEIEANAKIQPADFIRTGAALQALDLTVEWTVEKLLPTRSLTLLHSRGGLGKTWLMLGLAKAVNEGSPFLGFATKRRPVFYIDFENPLPLLIDRVRKLNIRDVNFWHLSFEPRPPKLDSPDWTLYKKIFSPGSLAIFDTLRASHNGDENSSQDAALVMGRLKEIREQGHDIIALHHTGKANDRLYKGSTAFSDLADHVLDFHRVRRGSLEEIDDDSLDPNALFSLGIGEKTRFAPAPRLYLSFDPAAGGFAPADDPDTAILEALAEYIAGPGRGQNQGEIIDWAREAGVGPKMRSSFIALLRRGEGRRWSSYRGFKGARHYEPIS